MLLTHELVKAARAHSDSKWGTRAELIIKDSIKKVWGLITGHCHYYTAMVWQCQSNWCVWCADKADYRGVQIAEAYILFGEAWRYWAKVEFSHPQIFWSAT